jgi:hypothetical protein
VKKRGARDPLEDDGIELALVSELATLDVEEAAPPDVAVACAGELLALHDGAPPVVFDSGAMRVVRGRVMLEAARRGQRGAVAAVDVGERPELRAGYVLAWDALAPLLVSRDGFARVLERLERAAGEGVGPLPRPGRLPPPAELGER